MTTWIGHQPRISNFLILILLVILDSKVYERHMHLKATIGTLDMEDEAYVKCYYMAWIFYPIFICIGIFQVILFVLYNHKCHPFRNLLEEPAADAGE